MVHGGEKGGERRERRKLTDRHSRHSRCPFFSESNRFVPGKRSGMWAGSDGAGGRKLE